MNELNINVNGATDEQVNALIEQYGNEHAVKMGFKFALALLDEESTLLNIKFFGETIVEKANGMFGGVSTTYEQQANHDHMSSFSA